jgi:hypothetical protein
VVVPSDYLEVVAREAFAEGMGVATLTAVGLMLAAAMVAASTLPNKAEHPGLMTERAGPVMNSNQLRSSERRDGENAALRNGS